MDSEDSAPEDVPIGSEPVDALFTKRLTAKKIQQEKKHKDQISGGQKKLKPLPQDVLDQLSQEIPDAIAPVPKSLKKGKTLKKKLRKATATSESFDLKKLPDFIPLSGIPKSCSTKFKVGVINSIVKNPADKNYKEHRLYRSKQALSGRNGNVKKDIVKRTLIKIILSRK